MEKVSMAPCKDACKFVKCYIFKKNYTHEVIQKTDSQTLKTNLELPKGKCGGGGNKIGNWNERIYTTIYMIDHQ